MSWLLYGIVFAGPQHGVEPPPVLPSGVGGAPMRLIETSGLGAAVSGVGPQELTATVRRALAYAGVIEALHARRTVLPMRYGCVLDQDSDVVELLRAHRGAYEARLWELDGCVEMGVRILAGGLERAGRGDDGPQSAECRRDGSRPFPGTAYLGRRKEMHADRARRAHDAAMSVRWLRAALAGQYLKCNTDHGPAPGAHSIFRVPLPSVHFLVRRAGVPSFRAAFLRIDLAEQARLLLTGPWPPYNFAVPDVRSE